MSGLLASAMRMLLLDAAIARSRRDRWKESVVIGSNIQTPKERTEQYKIINRLSHSYSIILLVNKPDGQGRTVTPQASFSLHAKAFFSDVEPLPLS